MFFERPTYTFPEEAGHISDEIALVKGLDIPTEQNISVAVNVFLVTAELGWFS